MNKDLLFQLYAIHSPSRREKKMRKFLKKQAKACGATSIVQDEHGNILITKGVSATYPCLASHIDQVQEDHSKDFRVFEHGDICFGYSAKSMAQQGLGADDKNGIFICLECLRKYDVLKVAFFAGEEIGCIGSSAVDLTFFKDCRFIVEPDRMNGNDLITSMSVGDVCSDEFIKAIGAEDFGYVEEVGSITDVGELVERGVGISCLNLSCGYYHAHTSGEVTKLSELENCLRFVEHIVETCTDVYPYEYKPSYRSSFSWYDKLYGKSYGKSYGSYFGDYYGTEYYDYGYYDEDLDMMRNLLSFELIPFEEVMSTWITNFYTRDKWTLEEIYEDACYELGYTDDEEAENKKKVV